MSEFDLLLRQGTLVSSAGVRRADLGIADGVIVAEAPELSESADEEIDCAGLHIFPGVIDAHVHFNEPGRTEWEGFATGTRALAAGGVTTYIEMPLNAHPPTTDGASFRLKLAAAQSSSLVLILTYSTSLIASTSWLRLADARARCPRTGWG